MTFVFTKTDAEKAVALFIFATLFLVIASTKVKLLIDFRRNRFN